MWVRPPPPAPCTFTRRRSVLPFGTVVQDTFHKLATHIEPERHFIAALVDECKKHGYIGFKFDFENQGGTTLISYA